MPGARSGGRIVKTTLLGFCVALLFSVTTTRAIAADRIWTIECTQEAIDKEFGEGETFITDDKLNESELGADMSFSKRLRGLVYATTGKTMDTVPLPEPIKVFYMERGKKFAYPPIVICSKGKVIFYRMTYNGDPKALDSNLTKKYGKATGKFGIERISVRANQEKKVVVTRPIGDGAIHIYYFSPTLVQFWKDIDKKTAHNAERKQESEESRLR